MLFNLNKKNRSLIVMSLHSRISCKLILHINIHCVRQFIYPIYTQKFLEVCNQRSEFPLSGFIRSIKYSHAYVPHISLLSLSLSLSRSSLLLTNVFWWHVMSQPTRSDTSDCMHETNRFIEEISRYYLEGGRINCRWI